MSEVEVADRLVATAVGEFGRLDGLVNNAGVLRDRTLAKMTPEEWDTVIRVHLRGHYAPTHAALGHWKASTAAPAASSAPRPPPGCSATSASPTTAPPRPASPPSPPSWRWRSARLGRHLQRDRAGRAHPDDRGRVRGDPRRATAAASTSGTRTTWRRWSPSCSATRAAHISGKVFGVQGDAVELYRPWTSAAAVENGGSRWDPEVLAGRVDELFAAADIVPGAENMMARLRYTMTERSCCLVLAFVVARLVSGRSSFPSAGQDVGRGFADGAVGHADRRGSRRVDADHHDGCSSRVDDPTSAGVAGVG